MQPAGPKRAHQWTPDYVVDVNGPELMVRTYIEQADVRGYLRRIAEQRPVGKAADVGAGYGRLSQVLREFSDEVVAFERDDTFVRKGQFLLPEIEFRAISSLAALPAADDEFSFTMTFTVLQHLTDEEAVAALQQIRRVTRPDGFVLLCEESDVDFAEGDPASGSGYFTSGRTEDFYAAQLRPYRLVAKSPRRIEPGYPRRNTGDYLLFGPS